MKSAFTGDGISIRVFSPQHIEKESTQAILIEEFSIPKSDTQEMPYV